MTDIDPVDWLRKFKEKSGWSIDRLSKEIGVHHQTVQGWLSGKYKPSALARRALMEFVIKNI